MSESIQTFETGTADNIRIDRYLAEQFPDRSRAFLQKLIRSGEVTVNGRPVTKVSTLLAPGAQVTVCIPEARPAEILPEDIPLSILYEDEDLLVIDKPKGMVVHPSAGHAGGTLVNAVLYHCRGQLSGINGEIRPGIVHRIDKDTTGALIVCKNDSAHRKIAEQIKAHSVTRRYVGIVYGNFSDTTGTVEGPIGRHPVHRQKMAVNPKNGKPAVTHYTVLEQFRGYSYLQFELETGRTHQIRVHMASIHHPLLGDTVYGPARCEFSNLQGQTLHARTIGFIHPTTGQYMEFSAPIPEYLDKLLSVLRRRG
jgi:23S rRNA pseudouridine1911/1915/1917 synthase